MSTTRQDILKILAYFDYFNYPLSREDIYSFLPQDYNRNAVDDTLVLLAEDKFIYRLEEFYSLQDNHVQVEKRRCGNQRALQQLEIAKKVARLLSRFPFVQTVAVSGSLSKFYADEKTDIDFFIITSANRLWIARTCMHILKKLSYLAGKQHWFCMNYYVDEMAMEIKEKNIFTAMEIVTLLPMQGIQPFKAFIAANSWTNNFFPQRINPFYEAAAEVKKGFIRKSFEKIFNSKLGDITDRWLMNITGSRWKKKSENKHGKRIGMIVNRHFSKPDPKNFQVKVVQQYERSVKELLKSIERVHAGL